MPRDSSVTASAPLCLACSSSLPPRLWKRTLESAKNETAASSLSSGVSTDSARRPSSELFLTQCCGRPICPSCVTSNPRLARYNPCLACLGGLGAVGSEKMLRLKHQAQSNVDGAVRDEDVFVVGDEEDEEEGTSEMREGEAAKAAGELPPSVAQPPKSDMSLEHRVDPIPSDKVPDDNQGSPGRYHIRPDDTLLGISFRLGIDVSTTHKSSYFVRSCSNCASGPNALQAERSPAKYAAHDATLAAHANDPRAPSLTLTTRYERRPTTARRSTARAGARPGHIPARDEGDG